MCSRSDRLHERAKTICDIQKLLLLIQTLYHCAIIAAAADTFTSWGKIEDRIAEE
jgi:hypothetical protein